MKLYLTQILKEANEFGFANQSGNAAATSFSNTAPAPQPVQGPRATTPLPSPIVPSGQQVDFSTPQFKPSII